MNLKSARTKRLTEALEAFIEKHNLVHFFAGKNRVSFSNTTGRHVFYISRISGEWEYTYTEYPSQRAIRIFEEFLKKGLAEKDGKIFVEKPL